jgi:hypothetical protein
MVGEHDAAPVRRKGGGRGFTRAAAALTPALRAAAGARGFAEHRLLTDWDAIMGPEFARLCRPVKVEHRPREGAEGLGGSLVVAAEGAAALEVVHLAPQIVERVNRAYGYRAVARVRVAQNGAGWGGAPDAPPDAARARGALGETAERWDGPPRAAFASPPSPAISAIADDGLRAALARLEANIRARAARSPTTQEPDR